MEYKGYNISDLQSELLFAVLQELKEIRELLKPAVEVVEIPVEITEFEKPEAIPFGEVTKLIDSLDAENVALTEKLQKKPVKPKKPAKKKRKKTSKKAVKPHAD